MNAGKSKKIVQSMQYKLLSLLCFTLIIGFWCITSYGHLVQEVFLPSPTAVIAKLISMARDGVLTRPITMDSLRQILLEIYSDKTSWISSVMKALRSGLEVSRK